MKQLEEELGKIKILNYTSPDIEPTDDPTDYPTDEPTDSSNDEDKLNNNLLMFNQLIVCLLILLFI